MPKVEHQNSTLLTDDELRTLDAHWRAANYLAVGQIYLMANPLLAEPLTPAHIKPRLLGHWGTSPGLNLVHTHLNRVIKARDLEALCVWGPGHGGPAVLANSWLEGSYSETYADVTRDAKGMERLFRQFSFPGGVPSHVAPETPGSIHEGGELGYSLAHAYGAAFDNPNLLVACVIGDGEAETGPLAASWHSNKFLDPVHDGAVLPILHLNGYKIANPTVLSRIPEPELDELLRGYGHEPIHVTGDDPLQVHRAMAGALDRALDRIELMQRTAREGGVAERVRWPVIVLRTPKGWTGPAEVDGEPVEGTWRAHQVPLAGVRENPDHLRQLEAWLRSYGPEELFDSAGRPGADVLACVPEGDRRLGATLHANGGRLVRDLPIPPSTPSPSPWTSRVPPCTNPPASWAASSNGSWRRLPAAVTSAWWGPTRRPPTDWRPSTGPVAKPGRHRSFRWTSTWNDTAASWRSSPNTSVKAGWRATSSPAGMDCSRATRRSSTSSTRW